MEQTRQNHADEEDTLNWACEIAASRLLKKTTRKRMLKLCDDFGVPFPAGTNVQLADRVAEQLHYETDTDEEN